MNNIEHDPKQQSGVRISCLKHFLLLMFSEIEGIFFVFDYDTLMLVEKHVNLRRKLFACIEHHMID